MKKWLIALAALIVLLAAGVTILFFSLNSIVEKAVNTEGPKITGTSVHLDKADISLFSGNGVFRGFSVGNPAGFSGHAATVGAVAVDLDTSTVFKDVVVIRRIAVDNPELVYELGRKTSNFDVILKNIQDYADSHDEGAASSGGETKKDDEKSTKKVIIDELIIRNARATLSVPMLKLSVQVPLPEIRLTDIGRKESGASFARTALVVVKEVSRTLAEATAAQTKNIGSTLLKGGETVGSDLLKGGEKAGDTAKNLLKDGLNLFKK
ncbi:hypothetical protein [uncultured Mailhella sp.]|uniref:hypothetical protein n=1 Tax=uncultured Mailhella sp. TaxID=1981031 RepID=UPI0025ECD02B|nr:hypothetical protein [uncultured Mailhella sp.]